MKTWWWVVGLWVLSGCQPQLGGLSSVHVDREQAVADGVDRVVVTISAIGATGEPAPNVPALVTVEADGALVNPPGEVLTDAAGLATFGVRSTQPGPVVVSAFLERVKLSHQPQLTFTSAPVARLEFTAQPTTVTAGQAMSQVAVAAFDTFGHAVSPIDLVMTSTGPFSGPHTATTVDGVAIFDGLVFDGAQVAAMLEVTSSSGVRQRSAAFDVLAAAPATVSIAIAPSGPSVHAGDHVPVKVAVRDAFSNPVANTEVALSTTDSADSLGAVTGGTSDAGTFVTTFTTTTPGQKRVQVESSGLRAETAFVVVPGPVDLSRSTLTVSPSTLLADGLASATAIVTLVDAFGNPVPHEIASLSQSGSATIFPRWRLTDLTGRASFTLRSLVAETISLTATGPAPPLLSTASLTFTPPTFHLVAYVDGLTAGTLVLTSSAHGDVTLGAGTERGEFPTPLSAGQAYSVSVKSQPADLVCRVVGGSDVAGRSNAFVQVRCGRRWRAVSDGPSLSVGILGDGSLWTWGLAIQPIGTPSLPVPIDPSNDWVQATSDAKTVIALRANHTLWSWDPTSRQLSQLGTDADWASLAAGWECHALKLDGTLWTLDGATLPTLFGAPGDRWKACSGGTDVYNTPPSTFTLAVKSDGTLWGWGANYWQGLGLGNPLVTTPRQLGTDSDWATVSAGSGDAIALKTGGTAWTWSGSEPMQVVDTSTDWKSVTARRALSAYGAGTQVLLKFNGTAWAGGAGNVGPLDTATDWAQLDEGSAIKTDGSRWTALTQDYLGLPVGRPTAGPIVQPSARAFSTISSNDFASCGVATDGALVTWGTMPAALPAPDPGPWVSASIQEYALEAIAADGSLWGRDNTVGTLVQFFGGAFLGTAYGLAALQNDGTIWLTGGPPTQLEPGTRWTSVSFDGAAYTAQREDGTLWSQDGTGQIRQSSGFTDWQVVNGSAGIRADGSLWSQGTQLGTDTDWVAVTPWVDSSNPASNRTFAIKRDGTLWAIGVNDGGQISSSLPAVVTTLTQLGTSHDWVAIAAATQHTVGLRSDGAVFMWGRDGEGQFGDSVSANAYRFAP